MHVTTTGGSGAITVNWGGKREQPAQTSKEKPLRRAQAAASGAGVISTSASPATEATPPGEGMIPAAGASEAGVGDARAASPSKGAPTGTSGTSALTLSTAATAGPSEVTAAGESSDIVAPPDGPRADIGSVTPASGQLKDDVRAQCCQVEGWERTFR